MRPSHLRGLCFDKCRTQGLLLPWPEPAFACQRVRLGNEAWGQPHCAEVRVQLGPLAGVGAGRTGRPPPGPRVEHIGLCTEAWVSAFPLRRLSRRLGPGPGSWRRPPPTSQPPRSHFPASPSDTGVLIKGAMSILLLWPLIPVPAGARGPRRGKQLLASAGVSPRRLSRRCPRRRRLPTTSWHQPERQGPRGEVGGAAINKRPP